MVILICLMFMLLYDRVKCSGSRDDSSSISSSSSTAQKNSHISDHIVFKARIAEDTFDPTSSSSQESTKQDIETFLDKPTRESAESYDIDKEVVENYDGSYI